MFVNILRCSAARNSSKQVPSMARFLIIFALFATLLPHVSPCSCPKTSFRDAYYTSIKRGTPISRVKVLNKSIRTPSNGTDAGYKEIFYRLRVSYVFKNCAPRRWYIAYAMTPDQSSLCGVDLEEGSEYLMELKVGPRKVSNIGLCGVNILLRSAKRDVPSRLTTEQRRFLLTRRLCCGRRCKCVSGHSAYFRLCLGTICKYSKKPCADAKTCIMNRCDGCTAEWFDKNGMPACLPDFGEQTTVPNQFV